MNRFGVLNLVVAIGLIASNVVDAIDCNSRPDFRNVKDCCPHEEFANNDIVESCKKYLNADDNAPPGGGGGGGGGPRGHGHGHGKMDHNACYGECISNATGLIDFETMAVDEEKTNTFLSEVLSGSPDLIEVAKDAVIKCAEHGKEMHEKHANDPKPPLAPGSCRPCASMFMHCIRKEITINCPTSIWKNDEACNNVREFMMVCKPPQHRGPPE